MATPEAKAIYKLRKQTVELAFADLKGGGGGGGGLLGDVLLDRLVGHVARLGDKVPACAQMTSAKLLFQVLELDQQFSRGFALDILHDLAWRQIWRARQQNMHMVAQIPPSQYLDVIGSAYLTYQFTKTKAQASIRIDLRYFVIQTKWYLMSKRLWEEVR